MQTETSVDQQIITDDYTESGIFQKILVTGNARGIAIKVRKMTKEAGSVRQDETHDA